MNPLKSGRVRAAVIAGAALAAVGATGLVMANTSSAADSRWVTTTATTGDVTQTYLTTGSITRKNTAEASFAADGTVNSVKVSVGDTVDAGQVLATLDTRALRLALLQAETTVAQAELNLYNARHPSSSSSSAKKAAASKSSSSTSSGSKTSTQASGLTTVTFNLTELNEAVASVNLAVVGEAKVCDPIMAWVNEEVTGSTPTTAGNGSSSSTTASPSSAEPTASASPTASTSPSDDVSAAEASPTATATQYAATSDPTEDELKACATARAELITANATLQTVMAQVNAAASPGSDDNSSPSTGGSSSTGSSSGSSSTSVSKSKVASAKATLLEAQQKLQTAKDNLGDAELLAPISGIVGTVGLSKGDDSGAGSITIVGTGDAVVTIEVPLKTRGSLAAGQAAQVTPAGSLTALAGKVLSISLLETSGTSGDTPTYATTIVVTDPDEKLASGAKASVSIPVKAVTGVVTVPVSAVTPTGTGTATVQVLAAGSQTPTTTTVKTGAVGGGRIEITEGLTAGQVVVIADRTADIPSNTTNRRTTRTSTTSSSGSTASSATPAATTEPSAQPTK